MFGSSGKKLCACRDEVIRKIESESDGEQDVHWNAQELARDVIHYRCVIRGLLL